jgi:hypothetical protein
MGTLKGANLKVDNLVSPAQAETHTFLRTLPDYQGSHQHNQIEGGSRVTQKAEPTIAEDVPTWHSEVWVAQHILADWTPVRNRASFS